MRPESARRARWSERNSWRGFRARVQQQTAARTCAAGFLRLVATDAQLHLAPCMPPLIQSSDFTPGGGLTHSAPKYWTSTRSTRFESGLYLVRPNAIGWIACCPSASFIWINPPGEDHSSPAIA